MAGRRLRLCFVAVLGDSIHTKRWVEAMHERGHDVLLVTQRPSLTTQVAVFNPYDRLPWRVPKLHHVAAYALTRRAIAAFRPDLVHLHWLDASPAMIRLARHPGMQVPLAAKRAALRATLSTIAAARRVITYAQALEERLAA